MSFVAIPVSFRTFCRALTITTRCNLPGSALLKAARMERSWGSTCPYRNRFLKVVINGIGDGESAVVQHNSEHPRTHDLELFHYFAHRFSPCGVCLHD